MFLVVSLFIEFVFVTMFVSAMVRIFKRAKKNRTDSSLPPFQNTISNANDINSYGNSLSSEPSEIYCDYCGSKFNKNKKRCPSCGARIQK